jgi:hypothetical protein
MTVKEMLHLLLPLSLAVVSCAVSISLGCHLEQAKPSANRLGFFVLLCPFWSCLYSHSDYSPCVKFKQVELGILIVTLHGHLAVQMKVDITGGLFEIVWNCFGIDFISCAHSQYFLSVIGVEVNLEGYRMFDSLWFGQCSDNKQGNLPKLIVAKKSLLILRVWFMFWEIT